MTTTTTTPTSNQQANDAAVYSDVFRGVLLESANDADDDQNQIVLAIPTTDYRLHLLLTENQIETPVGQALPGRINVQANRVDICNTGGQFIDPVMGRPRTVQGRVRTIDTQNNQLVIQAKIPIRAQLRAPQNAADFKPGDLVRFMVDRGATFTPTTTN